MAGFSALLTAAGHTAAGGTAPDLGILVVLFPLLVGSFVSVAERCHTTAATVAVLGAGQLALHELMELMHPVHHAADAVLPAGSQMFTMHAAVTLVTAVALRHADRAVSGFAALLGRVVPRRMAPPPADRPLRVLALPDPAVPARLAMALAAAHVRRGPPVRC